MEHGMFFTDIGELRAAAEIAEPKVDWGLGVLLDVRLIRLPRQRCTACGLRRICFVLAVENATTSLQGLPYCAQHAGIR